MKKQIDKIIIYYWNYCSIITVVLFLKYKKLYYVV